VNAPRLRPGARSLTRRQRRATVVLLVVALLFVVVDVAAAPFRDARGGASGLLGALARGTDSVVSPVRRVALALTGTDDRQRADRLEQENAELHRQLAQSQVDAATAAQLAALQLQATNTGVPVLPARVIGTEPAQGFEWTVVVDAGTSDGVVAGQSVVAGGSLVGRVLQVRGSSSTVLLIGDPDSGVGVRDQRTGQLGVLSGDGSATLQFVPLDPAADVQAGDQLLTGPLGSTSYVSDLPVATVADVSTGAAGARVASATPLTSLTSLDLLGILMTAVPGPDGSVAPVAAGSRTPLQPGGGG